MYDTNIVLDVNSGAVHVFDDTSYDILDYYERLEKNEILDKLSEKYGYAKILEAYEEISQLVSEGQLLSEELQMDTYQVSGTKPVVKALCLHVSHDCNLRCRYCFASTGDFGVKRTLMNADTGKKAIDFIIEVSGNRRNLEIDFFGGEPLMNFDAVREITEYASTKGKETGKNFRFTITTNALLLNEENKKFINEHMGNVVLSIDGRKDVNDKMRFRVDGSGTYETILPKIKDMAESRNQDRYYVRGTFTRENLDFSKDVLHLADLGFKQISIEPVVAGKDSGYDLRDVDLPILFDEYEKLALEYVKRYREGRGFNFFHFMIDLEQGPCAIKRLKGCGSGNEYVAVTPEGDIYPCHQFVGMEDFKMGNVNKSFDIKESVLDKFRGSNINSKEECKTCWAKYYCSGGCAANAYQFNGDIAKPYRIACELEKKRVECALWIKAMEME
jgi:six-Cys-in-45 modification radical SAM protein